MAISSSISRLASYYKRQGLVATIRRAAFALKKVFHSNGFVLFYCDLREESDQGVDALVMVKMEHQVEQRVERRRSASELDPHELDAMTSFWNPDLARLRINERFAAGAVLWLVQIKEETAGYGWTLQGKTMEPHFFPLGQSDAHLFDFHVLPPYRGQGLNPFLVNYILHSLAASSVTRALIEAAEDNRPQLLSLKKTRFRPFGCARRWTFLGHTVIFWPRTEGNVRVDLNILSRSSAPSYPRTKSLR